MKSILRRSILLVAAWAAMQLQGAEMVWSERDTKTANEYLSLLVERPEYGRVVDLLWDLYKKRDATQLLLDNIHAQAAASKHPSVLLVEGHLWRKAGDLPKAAALYDEVLKLDAQNVLARRARAEVAAEQGQLSLAISLQAKLAAELADTDPAKADAFLQLGNLSLSDNQPAAAVKAWEKATQLKAQDLALARTVAQLMLRAGYPERAVKLLEALAKQTDPQKRLDALYDLARVHEHADQFAKADQALRDGLALLDFRDSRYGEFFQRRVRLHERFGALDELRGQLLNLARKQPPTEQALANMARYFAITVDVDERLVWLRELVKAAPATEQYRWELVRALLDHEGADEAARLLDEKLKGDGADLPALVQLRAEADLRQGKSELAVQRLTKLLDAQGIADVEKQVLAFAQERSLDGLIERILKRRIERDADKPEAVFELATFYRARDRGADAVPLLRAYADGAQTPADQARRLNDAAAFLAAGGDQDEALKLQTEAAKLTHEGREELVRLADFMAGSGKAADAIVQLEAALRKAVTLDERTDIDDRLYSVLLGDQQDKAPKKPAATSTEFTLPTFITGVGFGSDAPVPEKGAAKLPSVLTDYAEKVIKAARLATASEAEMVRGAWWASRVERRDDVYLLLRNLVFDAATKATRSLPVELNRLILDIALADENPLLISRQLQKLIETDAPNRVQYLLRLAEQCLSDNQPDAAVVHLDRALREQPDNEAVLNALTQCYQLMHKPDMALALWRSAIQRTPGNAGTPLRERYAALLMRENRLADYVETQVAIVESETDIKRRRENFKRFLDQLMWSDALGGEVAQTVMQERLKLVEGRLIERTRKHPFDGFFHEALAAVFEKRGESQKAFASMKQAYYTSPDTPFSLEQLRAAALKSGDVKSAIYFQKQIAATAPPKELAGESRQLIQLLEQTFQIAEADKVRRRLENRLSQDAQALEDLAQYYKETGQDEAERRVYEQIQRVRSWEPRSTLRLALKCIAVADEAAAEQHLKQLLAKTQARNSLKTLPPERWPFPLVDERKSGPAASLKDLLELLEGSRGLGKADMDRLRTFLSFPRPEFAELPDDVSLVRLRGIEEMAKLMHRQGGEARSRWIAEWQSNAGALPIEKLWALYYAGAEAEFRLALAGSIGESESPDLEFVFAWLTVRARGMKEALVWMKVPKIGRDQLALRRDLMRLVTGMLADWEHFRYEPSELVVLGNARLLQNAAIFDIIRRLQDRQRYREAMSLVDSLRKTSPDQWRTYSFLLASYAQSAELWDLQRQYLHDALDGLPEPGAYTGEEQDSFLMSVVALHRLARTPQERDEVLQNAMRRLRESPPSAMTTMREAAVTGLAGAVEPAAKALGSFAGTTFLGARQIGVPSGGLMPQGSPRNEDTSYLRSYWEDMRMIGAVLSQQGLGQLVAAVDDYLENSLGSVQLGPRTSDTFSLWRSNKLVRDLREVNYPNRVRMIREFLASADMKEEDSVETLIELGRELEVNGMMRECIEVYKQLPGRAPTNNLYAEYFIRVCDQAWEPGPGRAYVESLFGKDPVYKPQGIGDERLREHHARYLFQQRDAKRLRELSWKPEGFTRVLAGRIAHEVPYARELALLLEHDSDTKGALEAWNQMHAALINGTPDSPMAADPECALHRARLMVELKAPHSALPVLREIVLRDGLDETRLAAMQLRVQLAAQLNLWDEVRELMTIAVDKKSPELALSITEELRKAARHTEALNFLTQAERAMKGTEERFTLRLEQLRFYALDKTWTPTSGRSQVAGLFRTGGRNEATMRRLTAWFGQQSATAKEWLAVLRTEARSGNDPALASLAMCALSSGWTTSSLPDEVVRTWNRGEEKDRLCIQLAAELLLKAGKPAQASVACDALLATPSGLQSRMLPIAAEIAGALKDEDRLRELYAEVVRMPFPGGTATREWATAFEGAGHADWARELFELANEQLLKTNKPNPALTQSQIEFLIKQRDFEAAESSLMHHYTTFMPDAARLIVKLYRDWGRLDQLDRELPKFFLPEGVAKEITFLSKGK
jgi:Tfp pilus assembly protein PilF